MVGVKNSSTGLSDSSVNVPRLLLPLKVLFRKTTHMPETVGNELNTLNLIDKIALNRKGKHILKLLCF